MENRSWDEEASALKCWEMAVEHVEKADLIYDQLAQLYQEAMAAIDDHRMMASALLALGGFGEDPEAYQELQLKYDASDRGDEDEAS